MSEQKLICDGCGESIEHRNSDDDYLRLIPGQRPGGGVVTDMVWIPEIEREHSFHRLTCLVKWLSTKTSPFTGKPLIQPQ